MTAKVKSLLQGMFMCITVTDYKDMHAVAVHELKSFQGFRELVDGMGNQDGTEFMDDSYGQKDYLQKLLGTGGIKK